MQLILENYVYPFSLTGKAFTAYPSKGSPERSKKHTNQIMNAKCQEIKHKEQQQEKH